jgi:putative transposase
VWARREIIRIKAHVPLAGARQVADIFNRNFAATGVTVGKTFVYTVLRDNIYEVEWLRKKWKYRIPKPMAKNIIWGMDMTGT